MTIDRHSIVTKDFCTYIHKDNVVTVTNHVKVYKKSLVLQNDQLKLSPQRGTHHETLWQAHITHKDVWYGSKSKNSKANSSNGRVAPILHTRNV